MKGFRENIIEGMMDCCNNCGAEISNTYLEEVIGREVDEYIMPKIQPLIDGIKQNLCLFPAKTIEQETIKGILD